MQRNEQNGWKKKPNSEVIPPVAQPQEQISTLQNIITEPENQVTQPKVEVLEQKQEETIQKVQENTTSQVSPLKILGKNFSSPFAVKEKINNVKPKHIDEVEEKPFNINDVLGYINAYSSSISNDEEKANLFYALSNAKIVSNKDYIVEFIVKNSMDEQALLRYKTELTQSIKNKFAYSFLKLEISIDTQERKEVYYNPMDKFFVIIKNNPAVSKLKEAFDADVQL